MSGLGALDLPGWLVLAALAMGAAAFAVRPEVWARVFLTPIDARPLGLMRIAVGTVVLWTFLSMGPVVRFLFTVSGAGMRVHRRTRTAARAGSPPCVRSQ